jgi:hypothetical protein
MLGGGPSGNFANSAEILKEVTAIARSEKFIARAKALNFSEEQIAALPDRLMAFGDAMGEQSFGGWADANSFLVGKYGLGLSTRQQRIMHELGHVLDDMANPGLFANAENMRYRGFYSAERIAYTMQYGFNPLPLTAFNAANQAHPVATKVVIGGGVVVVYYVRSK